jgi:hypothetical protein
VREGPTERDNAADQQGDHAFPARRRDTDARTRLGFGRNGLRRDRSEGGGSDLGEGGGSDLGEGGGSDLSEGDRAQTPRDCKDLLTVIRGEEILMSFDGSKKRKQEFIIYFT